MREQLFFSFPCDLARLCLPLPGNRIPPKDRSCVKIIPPGTRGLLGPLLWLFCRTFLLINPAGLGQLLVTFAGHSEEPVADTRREPREQSRLIDPARVL